MLLWPRMGTLDSHLWHWRRDWLARVCPTKLAGPLQRPLRSVDCGIAVGWLARAGIFYNYERSLIAVVAFVVGIIASAMVLAWLYNSTGGSVLAMALWHRTYNAAVAGGEAVVA